MAIITKPNSIQKGVSAPFSLSISELAALPEVIADDYFSDTANWSEVMVVYKSSVGRQYESVEFNTTVSNPTANFLVSTHAKDIFQIQLINIVDFDGGIFTIYRSSLNTSEFDVNFSLLGVTWDTLFGNAASTGGTELHNNVFDGSWGNAGFYETAIAGDFTWTVEHEITGPSPDDMMVGYRKTAHGGSIAVPGDAITSGFYGHGHFTKANGYGGTDVEGSIAGGLPFNGSVNSLELKRVGSVIAAKVNGVTLFTDSYSGDVFLGAVFYGTDARIVSAVLSTGTQYW